MNRELKQAQNNYMVALAAYKASKAIETDAKTEVLKNHVFVNDETGERITSPNADFMMDDASFPQYCQYVHETMLSMGLDIPAENTADYKTRPVLRAAEEKLIDMSISIVPAGLHKNLNIARQNLKYRQEMIDLTLRLDAQGVR